MGSSKKHKEKRDKKKYKKDRSQEREGHRRSHKSRREHDRRREDRFEYDDGAKTSERVKYEEKRDFYSLEEDVHEHRYDKNKKYETETHASASQDSEDDFDIDQLLDSKLQPEFSVKKSSTKKLADKLRDVELLTKRKRQGEQHDDYVSNTRPGLVSYNEYDDDEDEKGSWGSAGESANIISNQEMKVESFPDDSYSSSIEQTQIGYDVGDSGQVQLSLSISDTNKLRAKLGLKPLDVAESIPGLGDVAEEAPSETAKNEVFVKTTNISEVKKTEKLKEKIQVMKEKRKIIEKLSNIKPIGESDTEDESAAAWVLKSRKLQQEKEQAEKRAKLLEEMDAEFGVTALVEDEFDRRRRNAYTSKHLKGLKVEHDSSMLQEGQQIILTLKDKGVLDEDDDVLQNVNLVDEERYAKNVENRKKKKDYQPYEEEYDEFGILKKKTILSKYDEEIYGEKKKSFTLGTGSQLDKEKEIEMIRMKLKQQQGVTLEMPAMKLASEYYTPSDMVQFKRPKKKRKIRKTSMLKADDLLDDIQDEKSGGTGSRNNAQSMKEHHVWEPAYQTRDDTIKQEPDEDDIVLNEDLSKVVVNEDQAEKELHSALHKARKLKQRKSLYAPEKVAAEVLIKSENMETDESSSKAGPIVLNSTAEFCRTLGDIPTYGMSGNRDEEADELMDFERELLEERRQQEMEAQNRGAWNEVNIDETPGEITMRENEPILEEEPDISLGVAGALKLAQKKGYLDKDVKKQLTGPRASQLQAKSYTIEEKFYEDDKFGKRDRCAGPIQDFREKNSYKPDVKLEYIDDSGRLLNAKEAFRYLSHKFHGKGPGKNKVDKRMKKLDQDTKLKQMSSTDTPLNTVKLLQAKQKETQSPYIVLSGGSKALTQTMISKPKHP